MSIPNLLDGHRTANERYVAVALGNEMINSQPATLDVVTATEQYAASSLARSTITTAMP